MKEVPLMSLWPSLVFGAVLSFLMLPVAHAAGWTCSNRDMEITCSAQKCTVSDSFTPLSDSFDEAGALEIWAYSGCFAGKGKVLRSGGHLLISAHNLKWTGSAPLSGECLVAFDQGSLIAVVKSMDFAMPMTCERTGSVPQPPR